MCDCSLVVADTDFAELLRVHLEGLFGSCSADAGGRELVVTVDGAEAIVKLPSCEVVSESAYLTKYVRSATNRFRVLHQ